MPTVESNDPSAYGPDRGHPPTPHENAQQRERARQEEERLSDIGGHDDADR